MKINDSMVKETVRELRSGTALPMVRKIMTDAADLIEAMSSELRDCNNQLCLECGLYKERHNGACEGCRWKR